MTTRIGATATLTTHMIQRVALRQVDLCERRGDQWITVRKGINLRTAQWLGFSARSPQVERVFLGV